MPQFTPEEIRNFIMWAALFTPLLVGFVLERHKASVLRAQKAEKIGELFSYVPQILAGHPLTKEEARKFNQLLNELAFCLPRHLVCDLSETLCKSENIGRYKDCLVRVRAYVLYPDRTRLLKWIDRFRNGDGLIGDNLSHASVPPPEKKADPVGTDNSGAAPRSV